MQKRLLQRIARTQQKRPVTVGLCQCRNMLKLSASVKRRAGRTQTYSGELLARYWICIRKARWKRLQLLGSQPQFRAADGKEKYFAGNFFSQLAPYWMHHYGQQSRCNYRCAKIHGSRKCKHNPIRVHPCR